MPGDIITKLSKTEVRDLIEYLASLKAKSTETGSMDLRSMSHARRAT